MLPPILHDFSNAVVDQKTLQASLFSSPLSGLHHLRGLAHVTLFRDREYLGSPAFAKTYNVKPGSA
jgi:hypothetical protein